MLKWKWTNVSSQESGQLTLSGMIGKDSGTALGGDRFTKQQNIEVGAVKEM